jgi:hypothetical protein
MQDSVQAQARTVVGILFAGTDGIAKNASGFDFLPASPFLGFIRTNYQQRIQRYEGCDQQAQQNLAHLHKRLQNDHNLWWQGKHVISP